MAAGVGIERVVTLAEELTSTDLKQLSLGTRELVSEREYRFVDPFPKEVQSECSICFRILEDPQILTCCGYRFCKECIRRVTTKACPLCKERKSQHFTDKALTRQINQRQVYCLLKKDGCGWIGELCKVKDHFDFDHEIKTRTPCQYLPVPCEYCEEYVRRRDMESHKVHCHKRPVKCKFCGSTVDNGLLNHYKSCSVSLVKCSNRQCSKYVASKDRHSHLKSCEWTVLECKYKYAGCFIPIYRRSMEEHLEKDMEYHLELLSKKCDTLQQREAIIMSEKNALKEKVKKLENGLEQNVRVKFLVISDLPDEALQDVALKSRFEVFGPISQHRAVSLAECCNCSLHFALLLCQSYGVQSPRYSIMQPTGASDPSLY